MPRRKRLRSRFQIDYTTKVHLKRFWFSWDKRFFLAVMTLIVSIGLALWFLGR